MGCAQSRATKRPGSTRRETVKNLTDTYTLDPEPLFRDHKTTVTRATRKADGLRVAVKTLPKPQGNDAAEVYSGLLREVKVHKRLDHPSILRLHNFFEEATQVHFVLELCAGGDLHDALSRTGGLSEAHACNVMRQILQGIEHMHENGVIHRDIKLENVLMTTKAANAEVKVADFGFSKLTSELQTHTDLGLRAVNASASRLHTAGAGSSAAAISAAATGGARALNNLGDVRKRITSNAGEMQPNARKRDSVLGTQGYIAPEILAQEPYDVHVDIFACGVLMHHLFAGKGPDSSDSLFQEPCWDGVSDEAKEVIKDAINPVWLRRPLAAELLTYRWFRMHAPLCPPEYAPHSTARKEIVNLDEECKAPVPPPPSFSSEAQPFSAPTVEGKYDDDKADHCRDDNTSTLATYYCCQVDL